MGQTQLGEPCPVCPPFVVRCGHLGEEPLQLLAFDKKYPQHPEMYVVTTAGHFDSSPMFATRAEADAEFDGREEALCSN